jgi:hypothetical protein
MNIKSQFLDQSKFQDNMNMHFFFNKKKRDKVCKCVSRTPKLKLHIVPNQCVNTWKELTWSLEKLAGASMTQSISPKLELKHTCP